MFSTSPLSQDLPFTQFKLGRSSSSTEESESKATRHPSGNSTKSESSPHASNSYPQRATSYRQLRIRNNSFPFASLLIDSQTSFDQTKSQVLPKVPEDG